MAEGSPTQAQARPGALLKTSVKKKEESEEEIEEDIEEEPLDYDSDV